MPKPTNHVECQAERRDNEPNNTLHNKLDPTYDAKCQNGRARNTGVDERPPWNDELIIATHVEIITHLSETSLPLLLLESYQATWLFRRLHSYFVVIVVVLLYSRSTYV